MRAGQSLAAGLVAAAAMLGAPLVGRAQAPTPTSGRPESVTALATAGASPDERWEATLDGRVGFPIGRLRVGEFPTGRDKGYHFTYFFQEEKSHEDKNAFELIDNGVQVGLKLRF